MAKQKRPDIPLASSPMVRWVDNIKNPENAEFVTETGYNLRKPNSQVTQQEFNTRYNIKPDSIPVIKRKK
jgi:hypothetical protein